LKKYSILCAAFVGFLIAGSAVAQQEKNKSGQTMTSVVVAKARKEQIVTRVEALGTTRPNEIIHLASPVTEKIKSIHFSDGQTVSAGDLLIELESAEETAALESAKAVLEERRAAFYRVKKLEKNQFAAKARLDETRAAMNQAIAHVAVMRARLADRSIRAPFAGVLGLRTVSVGELLESGDEIITLTDNSIIKLDFSVSSEYLSSVRPGLAIEARATAFGDRLFAGEVKSLSNQIDTVTRSFVVRAELPNPYGAMLPGLLMTVDILQNPREAIVVPEEGIIQRGRSASVLVVNEADGNKVENRPVDLGVRLRGSVEVLEGLEPGELIVTRGATVAKPGNSVVVRAVQEPGRDLVEIFGQGSLKPIETGKDP